MAFHHFVSGSSNGICPFPGEIPDKLKNCGKIALSRGTKVLVVRFWCVRKLQNYTFIKYSILVTCHKRNARQGIIMRHTHIPSPLHPPPLAIPFGYHSITKGGTFDPANCPLEASSEGNRHEPNVCLYESQKAPQYKLMTLCALYFIHWRQFCYLTCVCAFSYYFSQ